MSEKSAMLKAAVSIDLTDRVFIHNNGDNREESEQCKIKNLNCFLTQQTTYIELSIHIYESEQPRIVIVP